MAAYYNEHDPLAAAWIRELIKMGAVASGEVDERDIQDVCADDLRGFTQCHFFAGIGVWSYALQLAGWPDDKPVWTGSCPCQPFSAAGERKGFADERHLWPAWHWLISQSRPERILGEQVASRDGLAWLDLVSTDLEASGYACGSVNLPACGIGAPHIRQRTWFVAEPVQPGRAERRTESRHGSAAGGSSANGMAVTGGKQRGLSEHEERAGSETFWNREDGKLADAKDDRFDGKQDTAESSRRSGVENLRELGNPSWSGRSGRSGRSGERGDDGAELASAERAGGATRGFWADADWVWCRDQRFRPVKPGISALVNGTPRRMVRGSGSSLSIEPDSTAEARVMRLKGYGNAINAEAAAAWIRATEGLR